MNEHLPEIAALIRRETGIVVKGDQLPSLAAALCRLEPGMSATAFLAARAGAPDRDALLSRLIDQVTVKETFFLRQVQELASIDWAALREGAAAAGRDRVNVWVAACASGEEAYTLAMLAIAAFADDDPPIAIVATDISDAALGAAERGLYGARSLRALDADARQRFFVPARDRLTVGPQLRGLVRFQRHNLVSQEPPSPPVGRWDLIVCRNVLIYFDGATVERVIAALERALSREGTLLLGAADRLCGSAQRLARMKHVSPRSRRGAGRRALRHPLRHEHRPAQAPAPESLGAPALEDAIRAADRGELEVAVEATTRMLERDPLDADAHFIRGLAEFGLGDAQGAATSLRRALYVDPQFGLAAFQLGRALEACDECAAAARAYGQALNTLDSDSQERHAAILERVDLGDIAAACAMRRSALTCLPAAIGGAVGRR